MWEHYKRTLPAVQVVIAGVTFLVYRATNHAPLPTAVFFLTMQGGAVFGAAWAARLKRKWQGTRNSAV
jgi:hypothetical protein